MEMDKLLGIGVYDPNTKYAVQPTIEELECNMDDETTVIENIEHDADAVITGTEGLYSLVRRESTYGIYPLTNLSGCESYVAGVMYANNVDLSTYAGMEAIGDGVKSVFTWIKNLLQNIWNFVTGTDNSEMVGEEKVEGDIKTRNTKKKDIYKNASDQLGKVLASVTAENNKAARESVESLVTKTAAKVKSSLAVKKVQALSGTDMFKAMAELQTALDAGVANKADVKELKGKFDTILPKLADCVIKESDEIKTLNDKIKAQVEKVQKEFENKAAAKQKAKEEKERKAKEAKEGGSGSGVPEQPNADTDSGDGANSDEQVKETKEATELQGAKTSLISNASLVITACINIVKKVHEFLSKAANGQATPAPQSNAEQQPQQQQAETPKPAGDPVAEYTEKWGV